MADTKISALTAVSTPAGTDEFGVNQGGTSKKETLDQIKTYGNTAPVWAAGTASANTWPKFTPGTLLTTPEDGALEMDADCLYGTTDAGNRGQIPLRHFIRCDSARTLPNDTNVNPIFNSPANGTLTLETGTYLFEALLLITGMSATSGNALINIRGAGSATIAAWLWLAQGLDATAAGTIADDDSAYLTAEASAASVVAAAVNTVLRLHLRGTFEVTAAGTLIPSIDLVTAAAASVAIGSFFMCERIGNTSVASVGQWT